MKKFNIKNVDIRKFLGTIIGGIVFICCILFFTYAYYNWQSSNTNVTLAIQDLSVECLVGADVEVSNIGPVLNYHDRVKAEFSVDNQMGEDMAIDIRLDITSISDNLLAESFKYVLVADNTGGTNYDYNNPIIEGNFTNFTTGNNLITQDLEVTAENTTNYQFIIYIDGNMYNDPNMQENSLLANLLVGNCGEDAVPFEELVYQAIYSETDKSLTFVHTAPLTVGETYDDKTITAVYTGFETATYSSENNVPWYKDGNYQYITSVNFDSVIKPKNTAYWFYHFTNLIDIDLSKVDTSNVNNMAYMFYGCSNLMELDVSNFVTNNVNNMKHMFENLSKITTLDLKNFNTSKVIEFGSMFYGCSSLISLDVSKFSTGSATRMDSMFQKCSSLTSLDLSNFDTSNVTNMYFMFFECSNLVELDVSNFDVGSVLDMNNMFRKCSSLISLNLSSFDTESLVNSSYMFRSCTNLRYLNLNNFDTSNVNNMSHMFYDCGSLISLDISSFDTSNVTNMQAMFSECKNLTVLVLDVLKFDTGKVTNMNGMFYNCAKVTTTLTIKNANVTDYGTMFNKAATSEGAQIIINYIPDDSTTTTNESTESLVDSMIATKSSTSNIEKRCYGTNCSA